MAPRSGFEPGSRAFCTSTGGATGPDDRPLHYRGISFDRNKMLVFSPIVGAMLLDVDAPSGKKSVDLAIVRGRTFDAYRYSYEMRVE